MGDVSQTLQFKVPNVTKYTKTENSYYNKLCFIILVETLP